MLKIGEKALDFQLPNQDNKIIKLSDSEKEIMRNYGAWGLKKNYGKKHEGVIRSTFLISPSLELTEKWSPVKVCIKRKTGEKQHAEIVLHKLEEISREKT